MVLDEEFLHLSKRDLVRLVMEFRETVAKLEAKVDELQKRLLAYENANTPPALSKRKRKPREPTGNPRGAPKGHEGTTRENPVPDKTVEVAALENCPNCHSKLAAPHYIEPRYVEEIPRPQPVTVTLFRVPHQTCACCGLEIVALHPDCPESGRFGYNTQTTVALLKYDGRLPHRKIVESLKRDYELGITPATVLDINNRVKNKVLPQYLRIIARIRKSGFVHIDETMLRVSGAKYWVWVFTTEKDTLIVIRHSRGMNVLTEILGKKYKGIIICDGHKSYSNYTNNIQRCWAHLLREVKHLSENIAQAIPLYKQLQALYNRLVERYRELLTEQQRYHLWRNANKRLQQLLGEYSPIKSLEKMLGKIRNGIKHWFTFILHPEIEPTNNRAERALRETVVQRKIFGCLRNEKGTSVMETLMSLIATWKQRNLNPKTELLHHLRS